MNNLILVLFALYYAVSTSVGITNAWAMDREKIMIAKNSVILSALYLIFYIYVIYPIWGFPMMVIGWLAGLLLKVLK